MKFGYSCEGFHIDISSDPDNVASLCQAIQIMDKVVQLLVLERESAIAHAEAAKCESTHQSVRSSSDEFIDPFDKSRFLTKNSTKEGETCQIPATKLFL